MAAAPVTLAELNLALTGFESRLIEEMGKQETHLLGKSEEQGTLLLGRMDGQETLLLGKMDELETCLLGHMHTAMESQEARLTELFLARIDKSETSLLLAFRKWAVKADGKSKVHDLLLSTAEERLDMLEHRIDDLERRDLEQRGNA